ncbi:hypothetical protein [Parasphingorhabdus flavimaris]|uniref:hypothetical protein n=1 Tax=Parasphingorhabdus flavimaris TaxID=266812 RepID=UPI0030015229
MTRAMQNYGRANLIQSHLGLTPEIGMKVAAIISFAGAIEHFLERALWRLRGIDPNGTKPDTDAKMISDLISMFEKFGEDLADSDHRAFIVSWCAAAKSGFLIRNNIAHGVPMKIGETLAYMRNPRWEGEVRKRNFGDFWADLPTLDLVREAMAVLYRSITLLSKEDASLADVITDEAKQAVNTARSVLGEFASQSYNPSFEKY